MVVEIETLTGLRDLAPLLAGWHHAEWGHLYPSHVWDLATATGEFAAMAEAGSGDTTWVAFDGSGRDAGHVLGSVSLVATDDLDGFDHLTPWLASMYVAPAARGRGVAAALADALLAGARDAGHEVVHLFTSGQQAFWAARGWSVVASVEAAGHAATVMARSTHPHAARRAACSRWCSDLDHGGGYSYLRLGATPDSRRRLAAEILPGLWFAGEATSVEHPATMHGAWSSGERAAEQVIASAASPGSSVAIVGAGLAGIAAARRLVAAGHDVVVFERDEVVGGRVVSDRSTGTWFPMGGAWLHGDAGHPLRERVTSVPDDWHHPAFYVVDQGRLDDETAAAVTRAHGSVYAAFAAADPGASVADVLQATLAASNWPPLVAEVVRSWIRADCEGLYAAPMHDLAANGGFEPFELPGGDHLVTTDLGALAETLVDGLDVRRAWPVRCLRREGGRWTVDDGPAVDAVIVTVPIGALARDRIRFAPALPDDVRRAVDSIGAGPVAKVFVSFDEAWWPRGGPFRLVGTQTIGTIMDVSAAAGRPTLVGFAVGEEAHRVEQMTEHELCRLFDRELSTVHLRRRVERPHAGRPAAENGT